MLFLAALVMTASSSFGQLDSNYDQLKGMETFTITAAASSWVFAASGRDTLVVTDKQGTRREFRRPKK